MGACLSSPSQSAQAAPQQPAGGNSTAAAGAAAKDPRFASVLAGLQPLFQPAHAAVCLMGGDLKEGCPAEHTQLCAWTLAAGDGLLVIEDAAADPRFSQDAIVTGPPGIRFAAGVALVGVSSSAGAMTYGALCVYDTSPRSFPPQHYLILQSMAAVVVAELERGRMADLKKKQEEAAGCDDRGELLRALSGTESPLLRALSNSSAALSRSGSVVGGLGSPRIGACYPLGDPASSGGALQRSCSRLSRVSSSLSATSPRGPPGPSAQQFLGTAPGRLPRSPPSAAASGGGASKLFAGVELGELLGAGGFGRVYRATWRGADVAVKVMQVSVDGDRAGSVEQQKMLLEAVLGREATHHPCLLQTYDFGIRQIGGAAEGEGSCLSQLWIISEMCNRGSLYSAIDKGRFRQRPSAAAAAAAVTGPGPVSLLHVLYTAREIAGALCHLHEAGIVHRDLTANNVLLVASAKDCRRFTIKVGDFGLSRFAAEDAVTTRLGTVSHMPPELLREGQVGKYTDAYSFGVLLQEMYSGKHPFQGLPPAAVIEAVGGAQRCPLTMPAAAPAELVALFEACVDYDVERRPSFEAVLERLAPLIVQAELAAPAPAPLSP